MIIKKIRIAAAIVVLLSLFFNLFNTLSVNGSEEYVYYCVVPSRIYRANPISEYDPASGWRIDQFTVTTLVLVSIIATKNDTNLQFHTYNGKEWVPGNQFSLSAMEKRFVSLTNGTIFKITSNSPISAMILGWAGPELSKKQVPMDASPSTYYTTPDGAFVGKQFVFVAADWMGGYAHYRILSLEASEITVTREDGSKNNYKLQANSQIEVRLQSYDAYEIESTGNIMVQSGGPNARWGGRYYFIPSVEGGYVGKAFYTVSTSGWDPKWDFGFRILSLEDANVKIWDIDSKSVINEITVKAGVGVGLKPKANVIMVESDKPVTLLAVDNGTIEPLWTYGSGVSYMGVKPNEETPFFLPTNGSFEAYVFAYDNTLVKIDDVPTTVKKDSYLLLDVPGAHVIQSNKNVIIEIIYWPSIPSFQGLQSFGAVIPCIQTVGITPNMKLVPITTEGGFPLAYLIVGVVATVVVAALGFLAMKRRTKK